MVLFLFIVSVGSYIKNDNNKKKEASEWSRCTIGSLLPNAAWAKQ